MVLDINSSIFAVLNKHEEIIGTGFLISTGYGVTCAHVCAMADAFDGDIVQIRFSGQVYKINARVDPKFWNVNESDIAILKLESTPVDIAPLRLGPAMNCLPGSPFESFGYAKAADVVGIIANGTIDGYIPEHKLLQLQSPQANRGISGAPVLDKKRDLVIGMITKGHTELGRNMQTTYAIPTETIWDFCSSIIPTSQRPEILVRSILQKYLAQGPVAWMMDPVLGRPLLQSNYCPLRLTEKRMLPQELVEENKYAIITGDMGGGKTSLMLHLVYEVIEQDQDARLWPLPISFKYLRESDLNHDYPLGVLQSLMGNADEAVLSCWKKGSLWLYLDDIDPTDKKYDQFVFWLSKLQQENERDNLTNRIWLNLRTTDFRKYSNQFLKWSQLLLCQPTIPDTWHYLQMQRSFLKEHWSDFYNYWISPIYPLEKQNIFGVNIALNYFQSHENFNNKSELLQVLTKCYLQKLLPEKLQSENMLEEANMLMTKSVGYLWESLPPADWKVWESKIDVDYFNQECKKTRFPEIGDALYSSLFSVIGSSYATEYRFMNNFWLTRAFMDLWRKGNQDVRGLLADKLVCLLENPLYWDLTVYCLSRFSGIEDWGMIFSKFQNYIREISSPDLAETALKFLWITFNQSGLEQQDDILQQILYLSGKFAELENKAIRECELALDGLAIKDQNIPIALIPRLSEYLIRRHKKLRELFHCNNKEFYYNELNQYSTSDWEEWLDILEQYPLEWGSTIAVRACFYFYTLDARIISRILSNFFFVLKEPQMLDEIERWEQDVIANPSVKCSRAYLLQTITLLHALRNREKLTSPSFIQRLYALADDNQDNGLKRAALDLIKPNGSLDQINWLRVIFEHEKDIPVKEKILGCLINNRDIDTLEGILKTYQKGRLLVLAAISLLEYYHSIGNWSKERKVVEKLLDISLLNDLSSFSGVLPSYRNKIADSFVDSCQMIIMKDAKIIVRLSKDKNIVEKIMEKLPTRSDRQAFGRFVEDI